MSHPEHPVDHQTAPTMHELEIIQHITAAQNELIRSLATLEKTATSTLLLKSTLLQMIQLANKLTGAEEGSIFALNKRGVVLESILARGAISQEHKNSLIGHVLDRGLAGWVVQHHKIGLIEDTQTDPRWATLPGQPYEARSALCLPLLKGRHLVGVLTLTHAQPRHFNTLTAKYFCHMMAAPLALALDNVLLRISAARSASETDPLAAAPRTSITSEPSEPPEESGIYILTANGAFQYANTRFTEIFDYTIADLVELDGMTDLFVYEDRDRIAQYLSQCFQGQLKKFSLTCKGLNHSHQEIPLFVEGYVTKLYGKSVIIGALRVV